MPQCMDSVGGTAFHETDVLHAYLVGRYGMRLRTISELELVIR